MIVCETILIVVAEETLEGVVVDGIGGLGFVKVNFVLHGLLIDCLRCCNFFVHVQNAQMQRSVVLVLVSTNRISGASHVGKNRRTVLILTIR